MAADARVFDGHSTVFGQDSDLDPSLLQPMTVSKAVNRVFRGGKNRTRPPFIHKPFVFANEEDQELVKHGNVQGATFYRKTRAGRVDCLLACIAGTLFQFVLVNETFQVKRLMSGYNPKLMHAWFCQAQDQEYVQNGFDKPIFWDGVNDPRYSLWPDKPEMPIGTLMTYAFGRVFLADAFDQVAASDIIYGTGFTNTQNTRNFTENTFWQEGGSFGMPTDLGHITGLLVTSAQARGNTYGQGVVLITGDDGAQTLQANLPRNTWKDAQIQEVTLTGRGCIAPATLINVNNRVMFRSDDGLSLYDNLVLDLNRQLSFGKFSQNVNNWFDEDTPWLVRYESSIYFANRILTTVSPWSQAPANKLYGNHRYHRGIVSLDLDRSNERIGGSSMNWDGLWTGIRPTVLVAARFAGVKRAFAFSFDSDGENRIYEISQTRMNDEVNGERVRTKWFYVSKRMDWVDSQKSNSFEVKSLVGGELHISEVRDRVEVSTDFRADNCPVWSELMTPTEFGPEFQPGFKFTAPRWKRFKFLTPSAKVRQGETIPSANGTQHQIRISGEGAVRVDRMRVAMAPGGNDPNVPVGEDPSKIDNPETVIGVDGTYTDDYNYLIVKPS